MTVRRAETTNNLIQIQANLMNCWFSEMHKLFENNSGINKNDFSNLGRILSRLHPSGQILLSCPTHHIR